MVRVHCIFGLKSIHLFMQRKTPLTPTDLCTLNYNIITCQEFFVMNKETDLPSSSNYMFFIWTLGIVFYIYNRWFVYIATFVDRWLVWQFLWSADISWHVKIGRMASDVICFCNNLMDLCFRGYDKQLLTLSVSLPF